MPDLADEPVTMTSSDCAAPVGSKQPTGATLRHTPNGQYSSEMNLMFPLTYDHFYNLLFTIQSKGHPLILWVGNSRHSCCFCVDVSTPHYKSLVAFSVHGYSRSPAFSLIHCCKPSKNQWSHENQSQCGNDAEHA